MRNLIKYCHKQYKLSNYQVRTMLMSVGSFGINALIGAGKLILGIIILSLWFVVTAFYYRLLCGTRGQLLWRFKHTWLIEDKVEHFE